MSPAAFSCAFTLSSAPFLSDYAFAGEQGELKSPGRRHAVGGPPHAGRVDVTLEGVQQLFTFGAQTPLGSDGPPQNGTHPRYI